MQRYKVVDCHFAHLWYWPTFLVFSALSKKRLYRGGANCTGLLLRLMLNLVETLSSNKITDHNKSQRLKNLNSNLKYGVFPTITIVFSCYIYFVFCQSCCVFPAESRSLQRKSHLCISFLGIAPPQSQFPNFHIHVSLIDLYIPRISPHTLLVGGKDIQLYKKSAAVFFSLYNLTLN